MFRRFFFTLLFSNLALLAGLALIVITGISDANTRSWIMLLIGAAAVAAVPLSFVLSTSLARRLGRPLRALIGVADKIGEGNSEQRVFAEGQDEIGELVSAFNRMSDQLDARIARLEEDRQQLRTILSGMVEGVVALDSEQRILYANERATQLLGLPPLSSPLSGGRGEGGVGRRLWEVVRQRPLLDVVQRALDSSEPQREELGWSGLNMRSLTVHAARLPPPLSPPKMGGIKGGGAARCWCCMTRPSCAVWNGCVRSSSPTSPMS